MPARGGRTSLYFDLLESFSEPGCSICRFALRATGRFLETLAYENTNDIAIRDSIRRARGFCNRHTAQYAELYDELGAAIIARDLLHTVIPAGELALTGAPAALSTLVGGRAARRARSALQPTEVCLACRRLAEAEDHYVSTLVDHLASPDFAVRFGASTGLCPPHVDAALPRCDDARRAVLLRTQRRAWEECLGRLETNNPADPVEVLTAAAGGEWLRP